MQTWATGWEGLSNQTADVPGEFDIVTHVRADAYRQQGSAAPPDVVIDPFDHADNTAIYVLLDASEPIGTIRTSVRDRRRAWNTTSLSDDFAAEINRHVGGATYVELGRLCVRRSPARRNIPHILALFQNGTAAADRHACEFLLAAVKNDHVAFYANLGFQQTRAPRSCGALPFPITLMCLNWAIHREALRLHRTYGRMFTERNN